jgi:YhcH/YjgK/YiaL family protein
MNGGRTVMLQAMTYAVRRKAEEPVIIDNLKQIARYTALHPGFAAAAKFLERPDLAELPVGRYDIDGDRVYALVQRMPGKRPEDARLEAHRLYIDIQAVLSGTDTMGWQPTAGCTQIESAYDAAKDVALFADRPGAWVAVATGQFAIFYPEDAHAPAVSEGELHKVVIKVACGA